MHYSKRRVGPTPSSDKDVSVIDTIERARAEFLTSFRWSGGHADFAAVFGSAAFLEVAGEALVTQFRDADVSAIVALEARGFVLGALAAQALGVGLVLARKPGSVHPAAEVEFAALPDWRGRNPEIHISRSAVAAGDRFLLVDDWIETGSQAMTVRRLVERLGGRWIGVSTVVDDVNDDVRGQMNVKGLVRSSELPPDT